MSEQPKIVDVEVMDPLPRSQGQTRFRRGMSRRSDVFDGPPVHPLSALLLLVVDNLWLLPEFAVVNWVVTVPLCFVTVLIPTLMIQKGLKRQRFSNAFGYSLLLAIIAAVPTSLLGTPVGAAMLAWFGISKLWGGHRDRVIP
jgi:ABC-type Fe3+ transport system permease subunit